MNGEVQQLLDSIEARGPVGEWRGYCPVHDDRGGNRSLSIDVKAKECDTFEDGTTYPRLYIRCRSCGANGVDVADALGLSFADLQDDAVAFALSSDLPARTKRPWPPPKVVQSQARRP